MTRSNRSLRDSQPATPSGSEDDNDNNDSKMATENDTAPAAAEFPNAVRPH